MRLTTLFLAIIGLTLSLHAQDSKGYSVGDDAETFNLLNVDGEMVSPEQFTEAKGFIVVFTCNHCPFSVKYEDRIIALHEKYAELGFPVIAINPNDAKAYPSDSYEAMQERAAEKNFQFAYLHDESQEVAKAYGATRTPHTFILEKKDSNELAVRYIGAIDDNVDGTDVGEDYISLAIDNLIAGERVETAKTKAVGCSIKWKK